MTDLHCENSQLHQIHILHILNLQKCHFDNTVKNKFESTTVNENECGVLIVLLFSAINLGYFTVCITLRYFTVLVVGFFFHDSLCRLHH